MKTTRCVTALAAAALILSGCVVAPAPMSGPYYGEPVLVAPPPPRVEYVGPPPVGGHWRQYGGRWEEERGRRPEHERHEHRDGR